MGKLTAYLAGVSASLVIVYYYLSTFYSPLVQWISPYVGPDIAIVMGIAFLFLGNPLHWPVLIASWILIGAVVGLGARKGSRAVGAALLVYYTVAGFLGLALLSMIVGQGTGILGGNVSGASYISDLASGALAPPPGTNLYTILTEPLIGRMVSVISILTGSLSTGGLTVNAAVAFPISAGGSQYYALADKIIFIFLPSMIANFVFFLIVSGLVGWYLNRKINPGRSSKRGGGRNAVMAAVSIIAVLMVVSMLPAGGSHAEEIGSPAGFSYTGQIPPAPSSPFSIETQSPLFGGVFPLSLSVSNISQVSGINYAAAVVGRYGDLYNIFSFVGRQNGNAPSGWAGVARNYSSIFTLIAFSSNISSLVSAMESDSLFGLSSSFSSSQGLGGTFDRYLNLIPGTTIVEDFPGNFSETSAIASNESSLISSSMNLSGVSLLASFTLPQGYVANITTASTLYLYGAGHATSGSQYSALQTISNYLPRSGTYGAFSSGIRDGYLVPGSTDSSVNSSLMMVGYLNSDEIENLVSGTMGSQNLTSILGNGVYLAGGVFQKSSVFFSPPYRVNITASEMLNYSTPLTFPSNSTIYGLTLAIPEELSGGNENYSYYSYSNVNNLPESLSGTGLYIPVNYSTVLHPSLMAFNTTQTFPARLSLSISTALLNGTTVQVNTTFHTYNGTVLDNFRISEYGLISSYSGMVTLVSGQTNFSTPLLDGQGMSYNYVVRFKNPGTYFLPAPALSYSLNGTEFSYSYSDPVIVIPLPNVASTVNLMEYNSALILSKFIGLPFLVAQLLPGLYVFDLIPVALVLIDIPLEYFWFKRTMEKRRAARSRKP